VPDLKEELHRRLQASRAVMLSKLDNLSEYDRRRPMTPTGTNLLGLVKHLAGLEYGYLDEPFGYPAPESPAGPGIVLRAGDRISLLVPAPGRPGQSLRATPP
jgi:Protein of unknown function (DUF664)